MDKEWTPEEVLQYELDREINLVISDLKSLKREIPIAKLSREDHSKISNRFSFLQEKLAQLLYIQHRQKKLEE